MSRENDPLLAKAVAGDSAALQKLLVSHRAGLARYVDHKLPALLREQVDRDDIVQLTYIEVFRSISRFQLETYESFAAWLHGIADHVVQDTLKRQQRVKRGGKARRIRHVRPSESQSVADLVDFLSADGHSPSRSVMGHEAVAALTRAIEDLPEDYREAVQLRLLAGHSLEDTADAMQRSPRAIQGIIDRAKKKMRAALVDLSKYQ